MPEKKLHKEALGCIINVHTREIRTNDCGVLLLLLLLLLIFQNSKSGNNYFFKSLIINFLSIFFLDCFRK